MNTALIVALILVAVLTVGSGLAAVTAGFVLPWLAPRISRPRLYGLGQLLYGGFTVLLVLSRIDQKLVYRSQTLMVSGFVCAVAGSVLSFLAQRSRRVPAVPVTTWPSHGQHDLPE